jgi:hypothetical protein
MPRIAPLRAGVDAARSLESAFHSPSPPGGRGGDVSAYCGRGRALRPCGIPAAAGGAGDTGLPLPSASEGGFVGRGGCAHPPGGICARGRVGAGGYDGEIGSGDGATTAGRGRDGAAAAIAGCIANGVRSASGGARPKPRTGLLGLPGLGGDCGERGESVPSAA